MAVVVVGVSAGIALASKPNVGLLALVAVAASIATIERGTLRRALVQVGVITAIALGIVAVTLLPVAWTGSLGAFTDQVLGGKDEYLRVGFSYLTGLERTFTAVLDRRSALDMMGVLAIWQSLVMLLPIVVVAMLVLAWRRSGSGERRGFMVGTAFAAAAIASVVPRPDQIHFSAATPLAVAALVIALNLRSNRTIESSAPSRSPRRQLRGIAAVTLVVAALGVPAVIAPAFAGLVGDRGHRTGVASFVALPIDAVAQQELAATRLAPLRQTRGAVFVVRQDAAFWYIAGGFHDPLPFDYPANSDFGNAGQSGVIRDVVRRAVRWICLPPRRERHAFAWKLAPTRLEAWVRRHLRHVTSVQRCELYRAALPRSTRARNDTKRQ
jgi:hypothetical protein